MEFTGERFVSTLNEPEICYEHWHRYLYASYFVENKIVLDIASGEGYGTFLLSSAKARKVFGVDIASEAVQNARETYKNANLEFINGSIASIPLASDSIDVLISFETIEHVDQANQQMFLNEIERVLKPDGILIISTPNKLTYSDIPYYKNEFHIKEFYIDEFLNFLRPKFKYIELLGQKIFTSSYIWSHENNSRGFIEYNIKPTDDGFVVSHNREKEILYAITICSNNEPCKVSSSILIDKENQLIKHKNSLIEQKIQEIALKDRHIALKDEELALKNKHLIAKDEEYAKLQQYLLDTQTHINELEEKLQSRSIKFQLRKIKCILEFLIKGSYPAGRQMPKNQDTILVRLQKLKQTGIKELMGKVKYAQATEKDLKLNTLSAVPGEKQDDLLK